MIIRRALVATTLMIICASIAACNQSRPATSAGGIGYRVVWSGDSLELGGLAGHLDSDKPVVAAVSVGTSLTILPTTGIPPIAQDFQLTSSNSFVVVDRSKLSGNHQGRTVIWIADKAGNLPSFCRSGSDGRCALLVVEQS